MSEATPADPRPDPAKTSGEGAESSPSRSESDGPRRNRRRGSRGGRPRARPGPAEAKDAGSSPPSSGAGASTGADAAIDDRRPDLPDRPGEGRASADAAARALIPKPKIGDSRPAPPGEEADDGTQTGGPDDATGPTRKRRRRGGRGRGSGGRQGGAAAASVEAEAAALDEETLAQRRGRERKGRPVGRYLMTVHVRPEATQIAVLEGRALMEHYVSRPQDDATQIHGNIYLGRVQNVLPGMDAAFVDIGTPKNAVLYRGDVQSDPEAVVESGAPRIEQMLRPRQQILG